MAHDLAALTEAWGPPDVGGQLIPLLRRDGSIRAFARVDHEDFDRLGERRWYLQTKGYACRTVSLGGGRRATLLLHRAVFGLAPGDPAEVDHKNLDRLDCRRENLRLVTHGENMQNNCSHKGSLSRFRGVTYDDRRGWVAQARLDGKNHHIGHYETELLAGTAAARWRHEHMPHAVEDPALLGGLCSDVPKRDLRGRRSRERAEAVQTLWAGGASNQEIADALGVPRGHIPGIVSWLRRKGHDLPRRKSQQRYSQHWGVTFSKNHGRWKAQATVKGKTKYLGLFDTEHEAAEAAATFRREHMPFSND